MQTYDFDRDYKDTGVARFTTKSFVVRNCLCNAKSDEVLSAWNPPPEWGKYVFLACLSIIYYLSCLYFFHILHDLQDIYNGFFIFFIYINDAFIVALEKVLIV